MSVVQLAELTFASPKTLDEACAVVARFAREKKRVWAIAGCTDWMVEHHMAAVSQEPLDAAAVDLTRVPELRGVSFDGDMVRIGAAEPFLSLRRHAVLAERCPLLKDMAAEVGAIQIQARGTLGGNLVTGSPAADGVTALFALDASVTLRSASGERTIPVRSYYTGYRTSVRKDDEVVECFRFRLPATGAHQLWRKVGTRKAQSISKSAVAAVAELDERGLIGRIGFGVASVAEVILPLEAASSLVMGKKPSELDLDAVERAVDAEIRPIDDIRSTGRYRRHVTRVLVRRFLEGVIEDS
jgi:CO/xanthine dehydrogenase FAD-binding subunit